MHLLATSGWVTGLAIPGLLLVGSLVTWAVRSSLEDIREAERQLAQQRGALYRQVLEPWLIRQVSTETDEEVLAAAQSAAFGSEEYKRALFEMTLYASDDVVRAFGDMANQAGIENPLVLWARILLAIRKSVGNKGTQLGLADILRPMINDIDANPEMLKILRDAT